MLVEMERSASRRTVAQQMSGLKLDDIRSELDEYYEMMSGFRDHSPAEVGMMISSMTARASHLRAHLIRSDNRLFQNFRTKELDPFIAECDRQWKIFSRLITVAGMEWEMSRGQR